MFTSVIANFIECDDASVELKVLKHPSALKAVRTKQHIHNRKPGMEGGAWSD